MRHMLICSILLLFLCHFAIAQYATRQRLNLLMYQENSGFGPYNRNIFRSKNGKLFGWGNNREGQLGIGRITFSASGERITQIGSDSNWFTIANSASTTFCLKSNGGLWAWGNNDSLQQGAPNISNNRYQLSPRQIGLDIDWASISILQYLCFALKANGTFWFSGKTRGIIHPTLEANTFTQIDTSTNWKYLDRGSLFAIKSNGSVWVWGKSTSGSLGLGEFVDERLVPTRLDSANDWIKISYSLYGANPIGAVIGLKSNGTLWGWGTNDRNQVGIGGDTSNGNLFFPTLVEADSNWVEANAGGYLLGLKADGTMHTAGQNSIYHRLGAGQTNSNFYHRAPTPIRQDRHWVTCWSPQLNGFAIDSRGVLHSWGWNNHLQLGANFPQATTLSSPTPVDSVIEWVSVEAGHDFGHALRSDGRICAWGKNNLGQLGMGDTVDRLSPVFQTDLGPGWTGLTSGKEHTIARQANGTLWAWGRNWEAQLGLGHQSPTFSPLQIGNERDWKGASAGGNHSLGLKASGSIWAWGSNPKGQLGLGNNVSHNTPQRIGRERNWISVSAGQNGHSLGLKADGTLWAWGNNEFGQIGIGNAIDQNMPVQIGVEQKWISLVAGDDVSMALKVDGTLWAWGKNDAGQLGDGSTNNKSAPVMVQSPGLWRFFGSSGQSSYGIKMDGTHWAWGSNTEGQFGNDSIDLEPCIRPKQIGSNDDWVNISGGSKHKILLSSTRRRLCATGNNEFGQLGDGTIISNFNFLCNSRTITEMSSIFSESDWFTIFPNPGKEELTIISSIPAQFEIYSPQGKLISKVQVSHETGLKSHVNLSLPNGLYYIASTGNGKRVVKKWVVAR